MVCWKMFRDFASHKIRDFTKREDFFDPNYVETIFSTKPRVPVWYLLNFVLWYGKMDKMNRTATDKYGNEVC